MEKMGSVFVMVMLAMCSCRVWCFGDLVHRYDYLYPEQTTTAKNGNGFHSEATTSDKFDHGVLPEKTETDKYDHTVISETSGHIEKKQKKAVANAYGDLLYQERTTTSNSDHVVSSEQSATNTYAYGLSSGRTTTANSDHMVSSAYIEGTTPIKFDQVVHLQGQSRRPTIKKLSTFGIHLKRNKRFMSGQGVYPVQTTTSIVDDSVLRKWTTRYNYDHSIYHKETRTAKYDIDVYSDGTTTHNNDHNIYPKRTRTAKYGFDVYSDRTTAHVYEHGVTTAPDICVDPMEKAMIGREMTCDIINITNTVSPSAWGRVYHVEKSSRMFWVWFDDSNYISVTLSKNCTSLIPKPFRYVDGRDLQDMLQDCQNGIVIQRLLCNPSVTYNISLVNDVIPYFSDVHIFFADGFNNCTEHFKTFIESKNSVLSNAHVNYFLTNRSNCWEYAFFTTQIIIDLKLNEIRNGSSSIILGNLFTYERFHDDISFILKHQSCRELFYQYAYFKVKLFRDRAILSIDNINAFNHEHNCLDVRFNCPRPFHDVYIEFPDLIIAYVQIVMAVEITIVNGLFLFIFLQKENQTPMTILLSVLAVSDTATVLIMTVQLFTFHEGQISIPERSVIPIFDFPECVMYSFFYHLQSIFHLTSIFITALLCLQKTAALLLPMWSKRCLNRRVSIISSVIAFFISISINSPKLVENLLVLNNFNGRCCSTPFYYTLDYHRTLNTTCYLASCLIVAICTIYIICKLTCMRRNLPWTDSSAVQNRNRISAITVMCICIIFLLSESAIIVTSFMDMLYGFDPDNFNIYNKIYYKVNPYTDISLIIGFSLNFIVYIVMSKQIREKLITGVIRIVRSCKCW